MQTRASKADRLGLPFPSPSYRRAGPPVPAINRSGRPSAASPLTGWSGFSGRRTPSGASWIWHGSQSYRAPLRGGSGSPATVGIEVLIGDPAPGISARPHSAAAGPGRPPELPRRRAGHPALVEHARGGQVRDRHALTASRAPPPQLGLWRPGEAHLVAVGPTALGVPRGHLTEVAAPVELHVVLVGQLTDLLLADILGVVVAPVPAAVVRPDRLRALEASAGIVMTSSSSTPESYV
jgi:hypothetical protein